MSEADNKSVVLLNHDKAIEYSDTEVFIDNNKVDDEAFKGKCAKVFAYEKAREYYKQYFSTHSENFVVLTGAGTSVGIGKGDKKGKTRKELWDNVNNVVGGEDLKKLCKKIKYDYPDSGIGDVEALLSKAERAKEYVLSITEIVKKIKKTIRTVCSLELQDNAPHQIFLHKLTSRKSRDPRVKLFTLNYDTLFEQAAKSGFTVIDGFSYGNPRSFNGVYYDYDFVIRENSRIENEENYVSRVIHLYKLHGSLDWEKKNGEIIKNRESEIKEPLIIYPNYEKYEVSYDQPFFEMMLRFQQSVRKDNVMLLVVGFSFYDKHITTIIKESLKSNPSFRMAVVTKDLKTIVGIEELKNNVSKGNLIFIDEIFEDFVKCFPFPKIYQSDFLKSEIKEHSIGALDEK